MACGYHQKNSSDPDADCLHTCAKHGCLTEIQCRDTYCNYHRSEIETNSKKSQCMAPYCYASAAKNDMYCTAHQR